MKGHVKLTTAEHRAWRVNKAQWVSPKGIVLRAVTPEEEKAIFPVFERVKRSARTETVPTRVVYKVQGDRGQVVEHVQDMLVTVRVTKTGRDALAFLLDVFVNGNRYVKGREIIAKRMLARHGECILFQPNGKRLMVVRNPNIARPTFAESQRVAPHPDHCPCRAFNDRREPGRHHIACEWNAKAPPHEQATPFIQQAPSPTLIDNPEPLEALAFDPQTVAPGGVDRHGRSSSGRSYAPPPPPPGLPYEVSAPPPPPVYGSREAAVRSAPSAVPLAPAAASQHPTLGAPSYAVVPSAPVETVASSTPSPLVGSLEVFAPEQCPEDCRGLRDASAAWQWPAGRRVLRGHHHPLCPHEGPYQQRFGTGRRWVLYDLERRTEVRDASQQEVAQSEVELGRSGTRSVMVSGRVYAVVPTRSRQATADGLRQELAASPSLSNGQHEATRQAALESSGLPGVPGQAQPALPVRAPAEDPQSELERLRARVVELERGASQPVEPNGYRPEPVRPAMTLPYRPPPAAPQQPYAQFAPLEPKPIGAPADHLRAPNGLIGNQLIGDDIPQGEVQLFEPEPFVDPLPAMQVQRQGAPAPYHPGVVHADGFVPPPLPTIDAQPPMQPPLITTEGTEAAPGPDDEDEESEEDEETPVAAAVVAAVAHGDFAGAAAASIASGA